MTNMAICSNIFFFILTLVNEWWNHLHWIQFTLSRIIAFASWSHIDIQMKNGLIWTYFKVQVKGENCVFPFIHIQRIGFFCFYWFSCSISVTILFRQVHVVILHRNSRSIINTHRAAEFGWFVSFHLCSRFYSNIFFHCEFLKGITTVCLHHLVAVFSSMQCIYLHATRKKKHCFYLFRDVLLCALRGSSIS